MPESNLWLLNSDGRVYTLSTHSRHLRDVTGTGINREFKRISALPQCSWALGGDHQLYVYVPSSDIPLRVQEVTYENERWTPGVGWSGKSFVPNARKNWSDVNGQGFHPKENFELPSPNWEWEGQWQVDENMGGEVSGLGGWQYAVNWIGKFSAERTWKTYVRRRKWVRYRRYTCADRWAKVATLGDEMGDPSELFLDVSIGGQDLPCQVDGQICVWAVTITGQVYIRAGVSGDCPEGHTWRPVSVALSGDTGVIEVSVGSTGQVWVVTWDGQALGRTNVSCETPYGTGWVQVPGPAGNPLLQVSVGRQAVWALTREGKIWFWKYELEMFEGSWVEMVGQMSLLSVSPNDQVLGIGLDDVLVHIRTCVSPELLTGKTWESLTMQGPRSEESRWSLESTASFGSSLHSFSRSRLSSYSKFRSHQSNSVLPINDSMKNSSLPRNSSLSNSSLPSNSPLSDLEVANRTGSNRLHSIVDHSKESSGVDEREVVVCQPATPGPLISSDNQNNHNSMTDSAKIGNGQGQETNKIGHTIREGEDSKQEEKSCNDTCTNQTNTDNETAESTNPQNRHFTAKQIIKEGSLEFDSLTSTSSECINFVTDLLVPSQEEETCNFVTDLLVGKLDRKESAEDDKRLYFETSLPQIDGPKDLSTVNQNCSGTSEAKGIAQPETSGQPDQDEVMACDLERSDSVSVVLRSADLQASKVNMNWIWVSATAAHIEDSASLPWLQSNTKMTHPEEPPIDSELRQTLLHQLQQRNRLIMKYPDYQEAVEKTVWVKRGHLQLKLETRKGSDWINCELELEQGLHGNTSQTGLIFMHFVEHGKQTHLQLSLADIVCVCRITVSNYKAAFAIYQSEAVKTKRKPYILSAASEKENDEWVASISMACSSLRGLSHELEVTMCWAVTDRGDVFVHQPGFSPQHTQLPVPQMYWQQVGGHMLMVKTNTEGVTWGISHDHTAYVYTGGYGGGIFKGISGGSEDVYPQTDVRQMCIYENQKWHLLTGYSSRYLLANKYAWTDETGRIPQTQQAIQTPSSSWQWISDWAVDFSTPGGVDTDGWQYTSSFPSRTQEFHGQAGWRDSYRRRRWVRRCRLLTSGPWLAVGPLPIIDVSIQPACPTHRTAIWAVGANGDALCRVGVSDVKPQGEAWLHVPADQPFVAVSIGGNFWVWAIARDESVWFRSGVSPELPTGKVWLQVVPAPPGGAPLQQISVGDNSVWAVDTNKNLWRRKDTSQIFPEGTEWELVSKNVQYVSLGQGDQVWAVREKVVTNKSLVNGVLSKRVGVSTERHLGTGWDDGIAGVWSQVCMCGFGTQSESQ